MYDMGNKDGFGMMWLEKVGDVKRVKTIRSMAYPTHLKELYKEQMNNNIAIHVRNATYGSKNLENCHPYCVLDMDMGHKVDLYMMHNGTIREVQVDKTMSDSYNFATKFLRGLLAKNSNYKLLYDEEFQFFLAGIVGPNKLVFLDNKNGFTIINSDLGSLHPTGCWVSVKSEIKLPEPKVEKEEVKHRIPHANGQFGHGAPWDYQKGEWTVDDDNRLHFNPTSKDDKEAKNENEKAEPIIIKDTEEVDGINNGIQLGSSDIDEEGLEELIKKLPGMSRQEVYKIVLDYHEESITMLSKLTNVSITVAKTSVAISPWDATDLLIEAATKKYGKSETVIN